MDFQLY